MSKRLVAAQITGLLGVILCITAACSQVRLPDLISPPPRQPVIPASVTVIFDESVRTATFQQTVCENMPWEGQLGDALARAFQETGQTRFAQVEIRQEAGTPQQASSPGTTAITASITLGRKSFTSRTRTGSEDNFLAQLDIALGVIFQDAKGQPLGNAPLVYSDQVHLWTPRYGGTTRCGTESLTEAMNTGAEHLAAQFAAYVAELTAKAQRQDAAPRQAAAGQTASGEASPLTVKVTMLDENQNLILESGERIRVRIDVTNTGTAPTTQAFVTLSGTPALLDAFAGALAAPITVSALQPGESTSAMVVGQLPARFDGTRGELTVAIASPDTTTGPLASHTLVAAMAPLSAPAPAAPSAGQPALPLTATGQDQNRYAVVVGLSLYRSPWAGWRDGLSFDSKGTLSLLARSLNVPDSHTLLLQDELASQEDIEEALASWLPKQLGKDSIVFFYFNGQALADPKTGEVYLIPYDGTPASSRSRLISLRWLQSRLQKLGAKLALSIIETPLATGAPSKDGKAKSGAPNWMADLDGSSGPTGRPLIQIAGNSGASRQQNGLLAGLTGPADLDHDGVITLGEWLRSLRGSAVTVPALPPALGIQSIPLSRVNR